MVRLVNLIHQQIIVINCAFKWEIHSFICLFCSYGDHVQHFKVLQDRYGQYYVWDELFSSLNELVEFYHSNSIAKERTVFLRDPEHFARVRNETVTLFVCVVFAIWMILTLYYHPHQALLFCIFISYEDKKHKQHIVKKKNCCINNNYN